MSSGQSTRSFDAASAVVWFVGISQGLVPLVVSGVFDRDGRFALPLLLPDPWWWISCLAVLVLAVVALLAIATAKERPVPDPGEAAPGAHEEPDGASGYDALSGLVLLVGIYNGLAPFVARLVFDGDLLLAFTLRLPSPWWWLASLAVVVLTVVLLEWIDRAKKRATGSA